MDNKGSDYAESIGKRPNELPANEEEAIPGQRVGQPPFRDASKEWQSFYDAVRRKLETMR